MERKTGAPAVSAVTRPIVYDLTHLVHRLAFDAPSGIDRVDLAFGRHFGLHDGKIIAAIHYGRQHPKVFPPSRLATAVRRLEEHWREFSSVDEDPIFRKANNWLRGFKVDSLASQPSLLQHKKHMFSIGVLPHLRYFNIKKSVKLAIPKNAIYLNIAQHSLEHSELLDWLTNRQDLQRVFFLHDLLPLDSPEFWWAGHEALFEKRVRVIAQHATALITSSNAVRDRASIEFANRGKPKLPIFAYPLPSPIAVEETQSNFDAELSEQAYFVVIGTIEPRKNHLLLLNIWRRMALRKSAVPRLIMIGKRGWENEQVIGILERCSLLSQHVLEITGLSNAGLRRLIANARGVLMPSFGEGYGLPLVEALSLGTPVIASDIPIFHEVTQEKAIFLDPIDGLGWSDVIMDLSDRYSARALAARAAAQSFQATTHASYFSAVESFLASL